MLIMSLILSFLMLLVAGGCLCFRKGVMVAALTPWPFLLVSYNPEWCMVYLPTFRLHVIVVVLAASGCAVLNVRRRIFVLSTCLVTLLSYGIGGYYGVEYVHYGAKRYPYESLEERLSYESRRDELPKRLGLVSSGSTGRTFDADCLGDLETVIETHGDFIESSRWLIFPGEDKPQPLGIWIRGEDRTEAIRQLHEDHVVQFIRSPSFGVARMGRVEYSALPIQQVTIPLSSLAGADPRAVWEAENAPKRDHPRPPGWKMHRVVVADFLNAARFGYIKDRRHVAGFQSHQFGHPHAFPTQQFKLKRLELVSLLKHNHPGVYVTENLPRMDLLRDVPVRPLDAFERENLRRLWQGDDLVTEQHDGRMRVLGALRAGKQCLSCHDAQRGDLLGAFSYHLDATR